MSEPPVGASLDEALIKSYTGGDRVVARDLHKGNTIFLPTLHLFMSYNLEPRIKDFSFGMVRRLKKLEWPVRFPKNEAFKLRLKEEIPAIAWFLVQCCKEWYEKGLEIPSIVGIDTQEYFLDQNVVAQFESMFLQRMPSLSVSNADMKTAFDKACKENGWDEISMALLSRRLKDLGYKQYVSHRQRRWKNVTLRDFDQLESQEEDRALEAPPPPLESDYTREPWDPEEGV